MLALTCREVQPGVVGFYQAHLRPRLLDAALGPKVTGEIRARVCGGLHGEVLEIGYGSGHNRAYLPSAVTRLTALEPSPVALRLARARRPGSSVPVVVVVGDAERLPFGTTFDAVLSTWTLCAVSDPVAALREVRRVLRPGGLLHFVEHGLAPDDRVARRQRRGSRLNKCLAGCVLDRDVPDLLRQAGFSVPGLRTYYDEHSPRPSGYFYEGRAQSGRMAA